MGLLRKVAAAALLWAAFASAAAAEWRRAESDSFIVYSEAPEARLRAQVAVLEDYAALLRRLTSTAPPEHVTKLPIYIVRSLAELREVSPVGATVGGFYSATSNGIAAFVNANAGGDWTGSNEVLFHEYAHHFMLQYHGAAYPPWYVEGFAEFMSTARFTDRSVEFGRPSPIRAAWLTVRREWLPMEQIVFERTGTTAADEARFYAQSWLLTHYLLTDTARTAQFRAYLQALARGQDPTAAFQASFGVSPAQMQRQVAAYAFGRMAYMGLDRASIAQAPRIAVTTLPRSADDLLLLQAAMRSLGYKDETLLARIRRQAARHSDPFARRVLAEAETLFGDGAAAERLLTELLAQSPNDVELLYLRGMRHIVAARTADAAHRAAEFRQARIWFGRAYRIDGNHYQTLYRYAQSYSGEPEFLSENNVNVLLLAQQLAPQVAEIRMNAASALILRRDFDLAEALLRPLASTAHGGELATAARQMLEQARAHRTEGVAVEFDPEEEEGESGSR